MKHFEIETGVQNPGCLKRIKSKRIILALFLSTLMGLFLLVFLLIALNPGKSSSSTITKSDLPNLQNESSITCGTEPRQNFGECFGSLIPNLEQSNGYSFCRCGDGFYGEFCEKTPCTKKPCLNGGKCSFQYIKNCSDEPFESCWTHASHFECSCPRNFAGKTCQVKK